MAQTSDPELVPATAHTLLRAHLVEMIRDPGPISRSQLSRAIGLPRSTTTALVAELLQEGLIDEAPARSGGAGSGSGRPATLLSLHRPDGLVAGFDFGHRHIRVAVATSEGQILAEESTLLDVDGGGGSALDSARELFAHVLDRAGVSAADIRAAAAGIPPRSTTGPTGSGRRRSSRAGPSSTPPRSFGAAPAWRSRSATTPPSARSAR